MERIGVRELQEQADEIVRRLRENGETFEITDSGRAVGRLIPTADVTNRTAGREWLRRWDEISREISEQWPEGVSALDAVPEQRREL